MKIDFTEQEIRTLEVGLMAYSINIQENVKRITESKKWSKRAKKIQIDDKLSILEHVNQVYQKMIDKTHIHL
jgi:hypothetical protein